MLTTDAFYQLISQGEGRNLEFKTSFGREAIESIAAFANSKGGGVLLIGVTNDGDIAGVSCSEETIHLDDKMIKLPLFEAVEETMMYILSHIRVAFEFTGKLQRKEIFEYPLNALREIVLNAIVHRDYTSPIDTQIKIFDDKITFFNPGRLYGDMTIEKLGTDTYQAQTRNKLIAEAFYLTGDIEKYGSGYIRIREEISAYPGMKFGFEEMGNGYLVTLSRGVSEGATEQATGQATEQDTEQAVLAFCRHPRSTTEIMHHLGLRHREHFRSSILMPLLERQLLRLTIPDKPSSPKQKYIATEGQTES